MNDLIKNRDTYSLLESWAGQDKNKVPPASHPCGEKSWLEFVVAAFRDGVDHGGVSNVLADWLVKEQGWEQTRADEMAIRYVQAIAVLKEYTGR